tara:strand:- start:103 stop:618 length:516 start_codon:yes stop_codon:yes gene_type:complete
MDSLMRAMQLIDKHSDQIPEGDYLEICNNLKKVYNKRTDPIFLFDYDEFYICTDIEDQNIKRYFTNYYFDRALEIDADLVSIQINYLENELLTHRPIRRISKPLRERVLRHYCRIYNINIEERYQHFDNKFITKCCRIFIELENEFRSNYTEAINKRIYILEDTVENLNEL